MTANDCRSVTSRSRCWPRRATRPSRSASSCTSIRDDDVPYGVLTGDTLFVGDVGRPDLLASVGRRPVGRRLGSAALPLAARQAARTCPMRPRCSLRTEPDRRAASTCPPRRARRSASSAGRTTALQSPDEDAFVATVTEGQPAQPRYFQFDARRNRELRPLLDADEPPALSLEDVLERRRAGAVLSTRREPADFAAGHLRGAVNVGLQGRFAEWAGDVDRPRCRDHPRRRSVGGRRGEGALGPGRLRPGRRPARRTRQGARTARPRGIELSHHDRGAGRVAGSGTGAATRRHPEPEARPRRA